MSAPRLPTAEEMVRVAVEYRAARAALLAAIEAREALPMTPEEAAEVAGHREHVRKTDEGLRTLEAKVNRHRARRGLPPLAALEAPT